jgi:WD40 repeat protein
MNKPRKMDSRKKPVISKISQNELKKKVAEIVFNNLSVTALNKISQKVKNSTLLDLSLNMKVQNGQNIHFNKMVLLMEGHAKKSYPYMLKDSTLASYSDDGSIRIWDLKTLQCLCLMTDHEDAVRALLQLRNGRLLSCSADSTLRVWDLRSYQCTKVLTGHSADVTCVIQLQDGRLASGSDDNSIKIWENYKLQKSIDVHTGNIFSLLQLKDGRLVSKSQDGTIRVWDTKTDFELTHILRTTQDSIKSLIQTRHLLWSGYDNGAIVAWNIRDNFSVAYVREGHTNHINGLVKLKDRRLLSYSQDGSLRIWDYRREYECTKVMQGHDESVDGCLQLNDGRLISFSNDFTFRVWNRLGKCEIILSQELVCAGIIQLDDGRLATGTSKGDVVIWN